MSAEKRVYTLLVWCLLLITISCGADHDVEHVRDYRLYVETKDPQIMATLELLVQKFNQDIDHKILTLVRQKEGTSSQIIFEEGLREKNNKLGMAQWTTKTSFRSEGVIPQYRSIHQRVVYGMHIFFDYENFKRKAQLADHNQAAFDHLYHLFCHEVGHGLQMEHADHPGEIMYPVITNDPQNHLDFQTFFAKAQAILQIRR
jgi:hypothetical protein